MTGFERKRDDGEDADLSGVFPAREMLQPSESRTFALHDAKNLAFALQSSLEWLQSRLSHESGDVTDSVQDMAETCSELSKLLLQTLRAEREGPGRLPLSRRPVPASTFTRRVVRRFRDRARQMGVELRVENGEEGIADVDTELIERVLDNLVDNALRVAPAGTAVTVYSGCTDDTLLLSVSDEGPGIPAQDQDRVFDLFCGSGREPSGGAGVGLTFCNRVVEAHGGRLGIDAGEESGTTFIVRIPAGT